MGRRRTTPAATTGLYIGHFTLRAEISYSNLAPGVGTWYPVDHITSLDTLRLYSLRFYGLGAAAQKELRLTVDGQVITYTHALGAWEWCNGLNGVTVGAEPERYALLDGRDILIEIRGLAGITALYCRGWYAERVI